MSKQGSKFSSFSSIVKFISGILSWVIMVILVIIAMFLLYYFISVRIYAQKGEQYKPAFALYTILSPSMVPNIKVYDVIVDVNVKNPEEIKEGDIITFISTSSLTKGMTITHRVVQVKQEDGHYSYVTKGDANLSPDASPAPFESVQGKVLFHIPQLGRVQEFLGTKGGWLLVVVLPALYIIISDVLKIFRLKGVKKEVSSIEQKESIENQKELEAKNLAEERLRERYHLDDQPSIQESEEKDMKELEVVSQEEDITHDQEEFLEDEMDDFEKEIAEEQKKKKSSIDVIPEENEIEIHQVKEVVEDLPKKKSSIDVIPEENEIEIHQVKKVVEEKVEHEIAPVVKKSSSNTETSKAKRKRKRKRKSH